MAGAYVSHARCGYCLGKGKGRKVAGLRASIVSEHYAARERKRRQAANDNAAPEREEEGRKPRAR